MVIFLAGVATGAVIGAGAVVLAGLWLVFGLESDVLEETDDYA